ncbi:MAG: class I adenylate-forming enzyme family protein [Pseudomonadales bacterium]|nr:class I adenylate-forming enzyme family protein [Pseudomonadales bacterium]
MTNLTRLEAIAQLTAVGQDYELETIEMYGRTVRGFKNGPATLRQHYEAARSDETFLVYDQERYSFTEAHEKAGLLAAILQQEYGIEKGDRVAISMRNYPEWVLSFMAVTSMGAIAVAMNSLWTPDEMAFGLNDSGAKVLFADQERIDRIVSIMPELDLQIIAVRPTKALAENMTLIDDLVTKYAGQTMPDVDVSPQDNATILYTSGSTGHPKGAVSCHQNIMTALLSWELDQHIALVINNLTAPEAEYQASTLLAVPLFHATGLLAGLLSSYRIQRKVVLMYKWDADLSTEIIEEERITSFIAPAAMTGDLVEKAKSTNRDLSSLATVGGGGAPRAPEQVKSIAASFAKAMPNTGWGMTETNAIGAGIGGEDYLEHPSSSGRCSAALDIKVIDEAGETLPAGERGELLIRGSSVIKGYWNRPEANAETFVDGWLKTGDVAYIDAEGYLYIVDRIKDLVIRGGENIGCAEVEAGLLVHPQVLEASVYAVPDERLGEEVGATIYTEGEVDKDALKKFLLDHIARFKIPRYIVVSEEPLLRIASGKIDKRRIREMAVEQSLG